MRLFTLFSAAAVIAAIGCSSADLIGPVYPANATVVTGAWIQTLPNFPGNSVRFTLHDSSDVLTGIGSWAGEAGPFGSLTLNGTVVHDTLRFDIVFSYDTIFKSLQPYTGTFVGVLTSQDELSGTLTRAGQSGPARFIRAHLEGAAGT